MKQIFLALSILLFSTLAYSLNQGDAAPDIQAKNQDGKPVKISEFKGKFLLLYFYPKDDTPGCTTEACALRDQYEKIRALNATVLGVSRQDEQSHQKFRAKYKLPFDLLVDTDGKVGKAFGVGSVKDKPDLHKRQSFLIGPDGKIVRMYPDVDPAFHTKEIIADIESATTK